MYKRIVIFIFFIVGVSVGVGLGPEMWEFLPASLDVLNNPYGNGFIFGSIFVLIGLFAEPWIKRFLQRMITGLEDLDTFEIVMSVLSILAGLLIGFLFSLPFVNLNIPILSTTLPFVLSISGGLISYQLVKSRESEFRQFVERVGQKKELVETDQNVIDRREGDNFHKYKLLDTSVIIDGRIADIMKTNFIEGTLMIPNFVLHELQLIADSSDSLKRTKGRRGLDILNELQKNDDISIEFYEGDFDDINEVDSKLVRLAKMLDAVIVTNDYNLNKVSEFQNIVVFNINELANALKPVMIPGDEMSVTILKAGTERKQGVAYLDDGTMIVVENGQHYMNERINVIVTSALQTAAGRMIFAKPAHSTQRITD